jgi:hypothetical protein
LRGVVAGSTQATVEALCQEINKVAAKLLHYPKDWKVELSNNGDLPSGVGDMTVLITPLVLDSISRQREQTEVVNGSERCSQMELLRSYGLQEVENDFLRVAVGLFQVGVGFSPEKYEIGRGSTSESVLEGKIVTTKPGRYSATVLIDYEGVRGVAWGARTGCFRYLGAAAKSGSL